MGDWILDQGVPPHDIEYQEPKGKGEVLEDTQLAEEQDNFVDDNAFTQSGIRCDDRFSRITERHPESGNAMRLLYCPSSDSLGDPKMMVASQGELLSSSAKHKKQAPKAQLKKARNQGRKDIVLEDRRWRICLNHCKQSQ